MHVLAYCWGHKPKGMYIDGHEHPDIVAYQQNIYVPTWKAMELRIESFAAFDPKLHMDPTIQRLVVWFHDKCIFKAGNGCSTVLWVPQSASPKPTKKGSGPTLMVSDLVSAAYRWLVSPNGQDHTCVLFEPGENQRDYFNSLHICKHIMHACDILESYPDEDHLLIFDNSPTHTKRDIESLSAQGMPKHTPREKNFLVNMTDEDGKKIKVQMTGAYFANGKPQDLYWPVSFRKNNPCYQVLPGATVVLVALST
ncbi:hypothetical protein RSOL_297460 [Rhizoctonia solani AG-3 Rhs1AP]|uniref:Uncharacterized protein n=2 Tax=Rhizoctonia solani AG-3 TaxID=1086053 RepID=A0A0A1UJ93_9AGAM|nr:hypothetical protein RSOL_297460 [Rhizoctonia solani AG-3 Rhs1AP]